MIQPEVCRTDLVTGRCRLRDEGVPALIEQVHAIPCKCMRRLNPGRARFATWIGLLFLETVRHW